MAYEEQAVCTVCFKPLGREYRVFGNRAFCPEHLELFTQDRPSLWRATFIATAAALIFTFFIAIMTEVFGLNPQGAVRIAVNLAFALLPPLAWLIALYRGDRSLPASILAIIILSALVEAALARPFFLRVIRLDDWLSDVPTNSRLVSHFLLGGVTHAFLLYATVRYTVWRTPSFQRQMDGFLFGMVAGWGYGAAANILMITDYGGLTPLNGGLRLLGQALIYLTGGVIVGYFLGRNRFEDLPPYFLSLGVVLAAAVMGIGFYASHELDSGRLGLTQDAFSPWPGGIVSLVILGASFALLYAFMRRHNAQARARIEMEE
jgi:RsiW-degrading membrane proteinase PrsW (M82 family)